MARDVGGVGHEQSESNPHQARQCELSGCERDEADADGCPGRTDEAEANCDGCGLEVAGIPSPGEKGQSWNEPPHTSDHGCLDSEAYAQRAQVRPICEEARPRDAFESRSHS